MGTKLPGLACAAALVSTPTVAAEGLPFGVGERIRWSVTYMKVQAGQAWVQVDGAEDGALGISGGAKNAAWYGRFYTIDDQVDSLWDPRGPGSLRYVTRFREGSFHQDQHMDIGTEEIRVQREQRFSEGWRSWEDSYPGTGRAVEDPTTAFFRVRMLALDSGQTYSFPVFSGRETWELRVEVEPRTSMETVLGELQVIPVRVFTKHQGDLEQKGRIVLFLSDDARRIPVRAVMQTNVGPIRADLISYTPADE